ncbi:uncharacterized protein LOC130744333 [Lotus japonicus]|uniref:uncharacterized protein LOC130744333 n=1 Tax=Lotus japonicus TaxID=34305 RepID=UPI00259020B7|nr:uncharacterized protein LOC130744333 [Lotus japonicus]
MSESESSENSLEESSSEETEDDDVPLAKRRKVIFVEEEDEQDDCEIIQDVLQDIRESSEAEESTDSDVPPSTSKTLLLTQTSEIPAEKEKEDDDVQILEPPFNVKPIQQVASNFEDQLPDAAETSYVSLSNYSAVNSRDLSFTSPEKTATSGNRQVTISEAEHMDESDHSGIEKNHEIESAQPRTESPNASSSNAARTSQPVLTLATSLRPQNLIQLIQEFPEEATRRLQWLYQVTDNQFDASFVDGLWSAFG